jgi:hypothetical protein
MIPLLFPVIDGEEEEEEEEEDEGLPEGERCMPGGSRGRSQVLLTGEELLDIAPLLTLTACATGCLDGPLCCEVGAL